MLLFIDIHLTLIYRSLRPYCPSHRLVYFLETAGSGGGADTCPIMVVASRNVAGPASRCEQLLKNIADVSQGSATYRPKHQAAGPPSRICGDMLVSPLGKNGKSIAGCLKRA